LRSLVRALTNTFTTLPGEYSTFVYALCFFGLSSVDAITRSLPEHAQLEAGLEEIEGARASARKNVRSRTDSFGRNVQEGMNTVAESLSAPIQVSLTSGATALAAPSSHSKLVEFDLSTRAADCVERLMQLEKMLLGKLEKAKNDFDEDYAQQLVKKDFRRSESVLMPHWISLILCWTS